MALDLEADPLPSIFDEMASEVSGYLQKYRELRSWGVGETPFLDFLKELFAQLLPLLIGCLPVAKQNPEGLAAAMNKPNLWMRLGLRTKIRQKLNDEEGERALLAPLSSAMLKMGQNVTPERAKLMLAA